MPFFAIKFFLPLLSAPFDGHRRCCDPAYGGPASRANNTGCLYLMYRMMRNMCTRPPRSAPLSCCRPPAVGGVLGAAAWARLSAEARLQGGGRRFCGTISCGGPPGIRPVWRQAMAWLCNIRIISAFALPWPARRLPCRMGSWPCAMKKLRKKCQFSLSFANFTSKP